MSHPLSQRPQPIAGRRLRFETAGSTNAGDAESLMRAPLPQLSVDALAADGEACLIACSGERLLVTNAAGHVVGMVCSASLIRMRLSGVDPQQRLGDLAGTMLLSCQADDPLDAIVPHFREDRHCVAVVLQDGRSVGTLHRIDVLRWLAARSTPAMHTAAVSQKPHRVA